MSSAPRVRRGAIVGFGTVAERAHLPAWQAASGFAIEAVVEPAAHRARRARELLPEAHVYADLRSALAGQALDLVDVCTPPAGHAELVVEACHAGVDVFCEKPLVPTLADLERIRGGERRHGAGGVHRGQLEARADLARGT